MQRMTHLIHTVLHGCTHHVPDLQWDWSTCLLFDGNVGLTPWRNLAWSWVSGMVNGVLGQKDQRIIKDPKGYDMESHENPKACNNKKQQSVAVEAIKSPLSLVVQWRRFPYQLVPRYHKFSSTQRCSQVVTLHSARKFRQRPTNKPGIWHQLAGQDGAEKFERWKVPSMMKHVHIQTHIHIQIHIHLHRHRHLHIQYTYIISTYKCVCVCVICFTTDTGKKKISINTYRTISKSYHVMSFR